MVSDNWCSLDLLTIRLGGGFERIQAAYLFDRSQKF